MAEFIILSLMLLTLADIGGWINSHSKAANRLCKRLEGFIGKATESIAWAIMGGK